MNASSPIDVNPSESVKDLRYEQSLNASLPILVTLEGTVTDTIADDEKASSPMVCTWSPIVIEVISYALKKAPLPIVVTLSGIVTDLIMLTQKA